jgi:5-bromo-4-chloroindolyl phosphate hydrolysis protein
MEAVDQHEREVRAARNQALFRAVNEKLQGLNDSFKSLTSTFTIACECADASCVEMLDIQADEYLAVRAEPRHFAVLPDHVYSDVERVVREPDGYVVVEKTGAAAKVAEILDDAEKVD